MNKTKQPSKFKRFLRNNAALLLLIFCVLAITAVVLSVTLTRDTPIIDDPVVNNPNDDNPGNPGGDKPNTPTKKTIQIYFKAPVKYTSIGMEYTNKQDNPFEYNRTLEVWASHKALDLMAAEGSEVSAMFDGTVIATGSTHNEGNYVIVDHGDNVIATYGSLQNVQVKKGQVLEQGDVIGETSISASAEYIDGAHLHLEITQNGAKVDPRPYIEGKVYREYEIEE